MSVVVNTFQKRKKATKNSRGRLHPSHVNFREFCGSVVSCWKRRWNIYHNWGKGIGVLCGQRANNKRGCKTLKKALTYVSLQCVLHHGPKKTMPMMSIFAKINFQERMHTLRLEGREKRFPQMEHGYFLELSSASSSSSAYFLPASALVLLSIPWGEWEEEHAWTRPSEVGRKTSNEYGAAAELLPLGTAVLYPVVRLWRGSEIGGRVELAAEGQAPWNQVSKNGTVSFVERKYIPSMNVHCCQIDLWIMVLLREHNQMKEMCTHLGERLGLMVGGYLNGTNDKTL